MACVVFKVGNVCSITVAAMTTSAREWRAAREEYIRKACADKECWNDLDRITCQHPYSFESIEQWPLDAAVICDSCASLAPAWVFDGCFWWNASSAVLCTKVGTSEPRRFTANSKHHFVLVCLAKASACKSACV